LFNINRGLAQTIKHLYCTEYRPVLNRANPVNSVKEVIFKTSHS